MEPSDFWGAMCPRDLPHYCRECGHVHRFGEHLIPAWRRKDPDLMPSMMKYGQRIAYPQPREQKPTRTPEQQRAFEQLDAFGLFFGHDDDEPDLAQTLNLNDVWAWALADGLHVPNDDLSELAYLFFEYGWGGVLYYADVRQGGQGSQFFHYQRAIEHARHEEQIRAELPDPSQRAFSRRSYTLGDPQPPEKGE